MTRQRYSAYRQFFISGWLVAAVFLFFHPTVSAASDDEEVVLGFSHPAVGQYYINAVYSDNTVYLPVMELFNLLYVHYEKGSSGQALQGTWLTPDNTWQINLNTLQASVGKESYTLTAGDFRFGELDLYISPELFERLFGLKFTVNMSALSVSLQSDKPLPVEEKRRREQMRQQLERKKTEEKDFPLLYPRHRKLAGAGMVDYNLMLGADNESFVGAYTLTGGMELLGGDVQGTVYGGLFDATSSLRASNLNWRYALAENPFLTSVRAGQITTTGLQSQRIVGGAISNDPIEPRKTYNTYSIDGNTIPDSEVELFINNQLSDFTRADALGYYRFDFPLSYGTVRISLRIYTPSGEIFIEERQLQIPFTFLPRGVVSYNIQGGALDDGITEVSFDRHAMHGDVAWGLTNSLTAKLGADYLSYLSKPFYYGSLSARVFDQYLLNIDAAPDAFYRATASVSYASSRNIGIAYTRFVSDSLYNPRRASDQLEASIYMPFKVAGLLSGFRLGGSHYVLEGGSTTNYNMDLNTRLGRFNIRAGYRDQLIASGGTTSFGNGLATSAVTYTFSRTPGVPVFVKGMFVRAQAQYDVHNRQTTMAGVQLSRTLFKNGRLNITADRDFRAQANRVQAGFTLDLEAFRSTTQYTGSGDMHAVQQTFNGSVGLDARSARLAATNREQVGRAAISVLMFIDSNDNRVYDRGEEKVPARAIRLSQSATLELGNDSILRITQLQSYWQYNAEVVQSALPNPTLAPLMAEFSFVTDPNRYKRIEIPLYRTGVIEGVVRLQREEAEAGLGGIRLMLKPEGREGEETIRTFSDGGFYASNLLPGKYTLEVDPAQLTFLNARSVPGILEFEVKATAAGDYIEGLDILLISTKP
jgi:hypothetical protein